MKRKLENFALKISFLALALNYCSSSTAMQRTQRSNNPDGTGYLLPKTTALAPFIVTVLPQKSKGFASLRIDKNGIAKLYVSGPNIHSLKSLDKDEARLIFGEPIGPTSEDDEPPYYWTFDVLSLNAVEKDIYHIDVKFADAEKHWKEYRIRGYHVVNTEWQSVEDVSCVDIKRVSPGVFSVPLHLPPSLEPRRAEFEEQLLEAQRQLRKFAEDNYWERLTDSPLIKSAEIYDKKEDYDNHLYELEPELKGKAIPKTFTAGIERDVFFAVSPEICNEVFPEGIEKDSYKKLILHELAHRLHVRVVHGREEKMGPVWFYEGFAVNAADQYAAVAPELTDKEIWEVVKDSKRGSYLKYRTVIKHFLKKHSLQELVEHAGDKDFLEWLKKN